MILTSLLRTLVPALWGALVAWLIGVVPALTPHESELNSLAGLAVPIIVAIITGAWYAFWRWLEPRLPIWLTRAVLGSAKAPTYPAVDGSLVPSVNPTRDRVSGPDHRA